MVRLRRGRFLFLAVFFFVDMKRFSVVLFFVFLFFVPCFVMTLQRGRRALNTGAPTSTTTATTRTT